MLELVSITDQRAITTSKIVADAFEKDHHNVLRAVRGLDCSEKFRALNFEATQIEVTLPTGGKRMSPAYNITRDGFTFLAMGFTGSRAAQFKERFIAEFNRMEQALLEGRADRRQVDVNLNHKRGITNPHGLDIKYSVDITKLIMKPTRSGLQILGRLTGVDFDDISAELDSALVQAGGISPAVVSFAREMLIEDEGAWVEIEAIHNSYCEHCAALDTNPLPVATFCRELRQVFPRILRKRSSLGRRLWGYENIRLFIQENK